MIFTAFDYAALAALVFRPDYPGNATARGVVEAPNGDPAARDTQKRYAHVADKYLQGWDEQGDLWSGRRRYLETMLERASAAAWRAARDLGVPEVFWPSFQHGALRVLEYPANVGASAVHTDFDLFTLNLYRSVPNPGLGDPPEPYHIGEISELVGLGPARPHHVDPLPVAQYSLVYFAIPDHAAVLPSGETVGNWIAERIKRSRYEV